jgi:hypothetical protein
MNRAQRRAEKRAQRGHAKPPTVRKVWATNIDTVRYAIEGAAITPADKLDQLMLVELAAIDTFTRGRASMREGRTWPTSTTSPRRWPAWA